MNTLQLSIVHRLPNSYRWAAGLVGSSVEPIPPTSGDECEDNSLVGLKLLSPNGDKAWSVMRNLSQALRDIDVESSILECEGEPCLFVRCQDEYATTCRLKNCGVAIAEPFSAMQPF
ncbi:hypothetical protein GIX45_29070 [Erwinia sp. CPCC 100877]|nr:hypothetical protein [Erwinia sp. CPCC 100877]